jgi:polar amino acid transport system ATP-binding protein
MTAAQTDIDGMKPAPRMPVEQAPPLLRLSGVHKWLGANHVLRGIDLDVHHREIVVVIGPSGSGKSTLLRCINHLERVDAGQISLGDELVGYVMRKGELYEQSEREVARIRRRIGFVFQQFNLFQHMTVLQNITYGPTRVLGLPREAAEERGLTLLRRVGLEARARARPQTLSGGEQQRVAIARALAMDPALMLFDEPTSSLDPELVGDVLAVMKDVADAGMTMIVVTHEMDFARSVGDTLVMIDGGVVIERGPCAEVIKSPRHERTEAFLRTVRRHE